MSHLKKPLLLQAVASILLMFFSLTAAAQVQTARYVSMTNNTNAYYEYLPQGYNPAGSEKYPVIIFIHGMGELGDGSNWQLPKILVHGIPKLISQGQFPTSFTVNGQTHKFIVISPQFVNWPSPENIQNVINFAVANYKVDPARIYVTGISMGGGATWEFAAASATNANRVAAIVPVCGASWPDYSRARVIANANLPVWATHNSGDGTVPVGYTNDYVMHINSAPSPNPLAKKTIWNHWDHDAWSTTYNPGFKENNMNVYEWMLQYTRGTAAAPLPTVSTYVSLPGRVEAEAYSGMSGVQIEGTADAGGGGNLGYIDNGDWMEYNVNPSVSGTYAVGFRVAAAFSGAQLQVRKFDGTVLATVTIPATGGWQTWQTVTANLSLAAGNQTLRVVSTSSAAWNFNYMDFAQAASAPAPAPVPAPTPSNAVSLPAKIQSEAYTAMQGVQKEGTSDAGGGENVGYIDNGDWMEYYVNPSTTGTFTVSLRVATPQAGGVAQIKKADGSVLATINLPVTGGWQTYQTVSASLSLISGAQNIRVVSSAAPNWNINWVDFVSGATAPAPTTPTNPTPSTSTKIEAESHTAQNGTSKENTADAGGGENVGWIDQNDWMEFSVNPSSTGSYTISFRVATEQNGGKVELRKTDGTVLATATVPNTGGWQTWQTVTTTANLTAGSQTLRVVSAASPNWNINWWQFAAGASSTTPPTTTTPPPSGTVSLPGKVEAEAWSGMYGVQAENTNDAGGGQNVGYIDYLDWMEYSVQPSQSGTYNLSLRVATPNSNAQVQIKNAAGTTISTINLPNTGGYQNWQNVTVSLNLGTGAQTLRLVSTGGGSFNINYLNFDLGTATVTAKAGTDGTTDAIELAATGVELYPNPVVSQVVVKVSNNSTGNLTLEIVGTDGSVKKVQQLQKTATGTAQYYLSLSDLAPGSYVLRATMTDFNKTVTFIKL